jgi:hypothetical protein
MANRLYNKQVTPKGYKSGGKVMDSARDAVKKFRTKAASEAMKRKPTSSGSSTKDIFKSYGKYDGKPIELKDGGRTKKMTESQKQAAKDAPEKVKSFVKGFLKRSPLNIKGAIEGYAGLAKDIKNRMGKKIGGRIEKVPGGYSKEGSGRISDKGLKGRSPTEAFKQKEMFKSNSNNMRVKKAMGGSLKPVDKNKNPGLAKLPTQVRNKMGFMKKGGKVK